MLVPSHSIAYRLNVITHPLAFGPSGESDDDPAKRARSDRNVVPRDDLPYKVELWNEARTAVEQVLAVTAHGSIGYAAYYAATAEHPDRYITLRHKNRIVSRWNESRH